MSPSLSVGSEGLVCACVGNSSESECGLFVDACARVGKSSDLGNSSDVYVTSRPGVYSGGGWCGCRVGAGGAAMVSLCVSAWLLWV